MHQQRGIGPGTASTRGVESHNVEGDETPEADRTDRHHAVWRAGSALFPESQVPAGDGEDEESSVEIASSEVGEQRIEDTNHTPDVELCLCRDSLEGLDVHAVSTTQDEFEGMTGDLGNDVCDKSDDGLA